MKLSAPTEVINLSVCLVSWNTRELLREALESIYQNTKETSLEVIVVDNASGDGSAEMVKELFPQVRLIANETNRYLSAALNQALRVSRGRHVVFLGSDAVVMSGALDCMLRFMKGRKEVGAVGGKIINPGGSIQLTCARTFPTLFTELVKGTSLDRVFPQSRFWGKYLMSWWDHNEAREVDLLDAACLMVRKEVVEQVGFLDEDFPLYSQDLDWCYRIKKAGWGVYYLPEAKVFHYDASSTRQVNSPQIKWSTVECRRSMLRFFKKHYGFWEYLLLRLLTVAGLGVKLALWQILACFSSSTRRALKEEGGTYRRIIKMCLSSREIFSPLPLYDQPGKNGKSGVLLERVSHQSLD